MDQLSMFIQYDIDKERFINLFSSFTEINREKIRDFLKNNSIKTIFEHPTAIDITDKQRDKIYQLKELRGLYYNLKSYSKDYIINGSEKAGEYFKQYLLGEKANEKFVCSFLDNSNRIIATKVLSTGTVNEAPVYPREISKMALLYDASSVILAHNHPGGTLKPSQADINITKSIVNALSLLRIRVLDHIIVGDEGFVSFMEKGISLSPSQTVNESANIYNVKENIIQYYKEDFPPIKHISEKTAQAIDNINQQNGSILSIKEIKEAYIDAGKKLEISNSKDDMEDFKVFRDVVEDLKQSQLTEKQLQAQERATEKQLIQEETIEMIQ